MNNEGKFCKDCKYYSCIIHGCIYDFYELLKEEQSEEKNKDKENEMYNL